MQIYFLLSEQKFEEYADVAAQKYWEEQKQVEEDRKAKAAADRQNREQRQQNNRGQGDRRKGGNRRQQDEAETGIKFGAQPPKFTSTKSKDPSEPLTPNQPNDQSHRQVTYSNTMAAPAKGAPRQQPQNRADGQQEPAQV